jgi:hypothetical protein
VNAAGRVAVVLSLLLATAAAPAADDPLAGLVLADLSDRRWTLDELRGEPVLLIVADRSAAAQAEAWGAWLAPRTAVLAPWRAPGKVVWLSVADLRRVPEFARETAREGLRAPDAARPPERAARSSALLLDWNGDISKPLDAPRGAALVVLLGRDRQPVVRVTGAPTEPAVAEVVAALARVASP